MSLAGNKVFFSEVLCTVVMLAEVGKMEIAVLYFKNDSPCKLYVTCIQMMNIAGATHKKQIRKYDKDEVDVNIVTNTMKNTTIE